MEEEINSEQLKPTFRSLTSKKTIRPFREYTEASNNKVFYNTGYGNSKYDENFNFDSEFNKYDPQSSIQEHRAQNQSWGAKASTGIARAGVKAGIEIAKLVPTVGGIIAAPFTDEGQGWETAFNNAGHKSLNALNEYINDEVLPVYVKKSVQNGNLMDALTSIDFYATDGADGLGFMLSMFAPGAALKALGGANKFKSIIGGFEKGRELMSKAASIGLKADEVGITFANTFAEAAAESGSQMEAMNQSKPEYIKQYISQGLTPEEAEIKFNQQKGSVGKESFWLNMGLLAGTNFVNTKMLGLAGESAIKKVGNQALRDADGKLIKSVASRTFGNRLTDMPKKAGTMFLNEGLVEEGTQTTIESYLSSKAKKGELTNNTFNDFNLGEFGEEYVNMLTTTEGQKAIALGGILGYGSVAVRSAKQLISGKGTDEDLEINRINTLLKKGLEAESYFAQVNPDVYKRTEEIDPITGENKFALVNGKKIIDPIKRDQLFINAKITEDDGKIWDEALKNNDTQTLEYLQNIAEARLINSFIADSQDGINILSEYLKDSVIPEDRKKSIIKKATALQKSHEQFISYSEPVLNLKNKDASNEDFSEFYQNLVNINKMNTLQQLTIAENLEKINGNVNNLLLQHGLTRDDLENFTLKSQLPQKDLRFEKELLLEDYYNSKLEEIKKSNLDLWNPKKQQEAFNKLLNKNKETRDRNSVENVATADAIAQDIENATTIPEINKALDKSEHNEFLNEVDETVTSQEIKDLETSKELLKEQINKKLNKSLKDKNNISLELNSIQDTIIYLDNLLNNTIDLSSKEVDDLIKQINNYLSLHNSNSKKATKRGKQSINNVELLREDIKNIHQLLNDLQTRVKTLQINKEALESSRNYLNYKIEYYQKLLKQDLTLDTLDKKIKVLKNKKSKLDKLINSLSKSIENLLKSIREIFNFISKTENELSDFQNKNDFKVLSLEEIKEAVLNNNAETYGSLKNSYDKQIEKLNNLLDHAEINEEIYDKKVKELNSLYNAIQKTSTQLDILEDLLVDDNLKTDEKTTIEEIEIVEKVETEITKKHKRPTSYSPTYKRKRTVDSQTEEVLRQQAEDKKKKIVIKSEEDITKGNESIEDEINTIVTEPEGVIIDDETGEVYDYENDKHYSNVDEYNKANGIEITEDLPVDNNIHELDIEDVTDISNEVIPEDITIKDSKDNLDNTVQSSSKDLFPNAATMGVDRSGETVGKFSQYILEPFRNFINNFKNITGTPVTFSIPNYLNNDNKKALELLNLNKTTYEEHELDLLYRHLPLQINIDTNTFTFIATLTNVTTADMATYQARKNIVDAILLNKGYEGITSKVSYQKGGTLVYDKTGQTENKITSLKEYEVNSLPLFFVKDIDGNIYNEQGQQVELMKEFPFNLKNPHTQKGYVYTIIHSPGGIATPVKLNVRKINQSQAEMIYKVYKTLYDYNQNPDNIKLSQYNAKLTDLYDIDNTLKTLIESNFAKELDIFKNKDNVTVGDFMTLFIHDNVNYDGTTKPYTTKYQGGQLLTGQEGLLTFDENSPFTKEEFINFLTTQKRQNTKLSYLAGENSNVNKTKYKDYLLNDITSVNIDTQQPFKGDINIYIDTNINLSKPSNQKILENNQQKTLNSETNNVSSIDNSFKTEAITEKGLNQLKSLRKKTTLDNNAPKKC